MNPWRLQAWLGHKRIDETMLYVHVAETHPRKLPEHIITAALGVDDPDERGLTMMSVRGKTVAKPATVDDQILRVSNG